MYLGMRKSFIIYVLVWLILTVIIMTYSWWTAQAHYQKAKREVDELNMQIESVTPDYSKVQELKEQIEQTRQKKEKPDGQLQQGEGSADKGDGEQAPGTENNKMVEIFGKNV